MSLECTPVCAQFDICRYKNYSDVCKQAISKHRYPYAYSKTGSLPENLLVSLAGAASTRLVVSRCPEQER